MNITSNESVAPTAFATSAATMEDAAREWVGRVAGIVTMASFVGSLSMSWRVWHSGNTIGVAFSPLAAAAICLHAWILYGRATGDPNVVWVNTCGLVLMLVNAFVHRLYSRDRGPGVALLATLAAMQIASPAMSVTWLGNLAFVTTVACNAAPVARIRTVPLPEIAAWTLSACGLWTAYGALARDAPLFASNLVGTVFAAVELGVAAWRRCRGDVDVPSQVV
ncbi:uncharacterized protein LOC142559490 [Dermacentor variabilis]|uniref:uncharacterized protein LOC142559490 n=1 Tax=Dermacentor variabilis TaxID=34621 RepID=UPI003F5B1B8A